MHNVGVNTDVLDQVRIKSIPEDFCVTESLGLPPPVVHGDSGGQKTLREFQYLRLKKVGFTTFEAIDAIAQFFSITSKAVTYCGLKDEDGVTDQMICVPSTVDLRELPRFNERYRSDVGFVELMPYGQYTEPLQIGSLAGNAFRLCIRGIPEPVAHHIETLDGLYVMPFINYYDTQRFGVPNAPKTTHLIGAALLSEKYQEAFDLLCAAGTPESAKAKVWDGSPREFFDTLDGRVIAFFMSANSSFHWNDKVKSTLRRNLSKDQLISYERDGLKYLAVKSSASLLAALAPIPTVEYRRYRIDDAGVNYTPVQRPTILHSPVRFQNFADDEKNPGFFRVQTSFFLPPGTYATNVINQLFLALANSVS